MTSSKSRAVTHDGDIVRIEETRPLSKQKRWTLVEKVALGQA